MIKIKDIFVRAHFIFEYLDDFFSKNTVKAIIPSHLCYVPYGPISRLAKKIQYSNSKNLFKL